MRLDFHHSIFVLVCGLLILAAQSCTKDSETPTLTFNSLTAGGIELALVSPTNVPSNATIVANMSADIIASSATPSTILLMRMFDSTYVDITVSVSGNIINIVPKTDLGSGIYYALSFTGIRATDGTSLIYYWRAFTTKGSFGPPGLVAYWNFEGNTYDQQGNYGQGSATDLNYAISFRKSLGQCAAFNGTSALVQIPAADKLLNTNDFSISFWLKANSHYQLDSLGNPKGQFVLGLADYKGFEFEIASDYSSCKLVASYAVPGGNAISEELVFAGDGKTASNGGQPGWIYCADLTGSGGVAALVKDQWAFITVTYESSTRLGTLYINGVKMKQQDFNQWPVGDPAREITGMKYGGSYPQQENILALGFFHSAGSSAYSGMSWGNYYSPFANHFRGWLDELRIFQSAITAAEVQQMYTLTKP